MDLRGLVADPEFSGGDLAGAETAEGLEDFELARRRLAHAVRTARSGGSAPPIVTLQ